MPPPLRQTAVAVAVAATWAALAAAEVALAAATLAPALGILAAVAFDGLARLRHGRSLLASTPSSAAWAVVLSIFLMTAIERLNQAWPLWTYLGWPRDELLRYLALGVLHAGALPLMITVADLCGFFHEPQPPISTRVAIPVGVLGLILLAGSLAEAVYAGSLIGFSVGLIGLLLIAESWNVAVGDYGIVRAPLGPVAAGACWGALLWIGDLASARRFLIVDIGPLAWIALCALLLGPAVLGAYLLVGRKLGLPLYPADEPGQETIGGLHLDR